MKKYIIITTINAKTAAIKEFEKLKEWQIVIVGDKKSKAIANSKNLTFLSIDDQNQLGFNIVDRLPLNHYTRKNIGYLYAIQAGADLIYDTDDDNMPKPNWGEIPFHCDKIIRESDGVDFINIYRYFTDEFVWPRGFPLDLIRRESDLEITENRHSEIGVWQGLVDLAPDVDAIYRLLFNKSISFGQQAPVALQKGAFCPFNSQNTMWNRDVFPLLYLPATVSFRHTDILRSFIAQRLMWAQDLHVGFHQATVNQNRNPHDLMKDFENELECYISTKAIVDILRKEIFSGSIFDNMKHVYKELQRDNLVGPDELDILDAWCSDLKIIHKAISALKSTEGNEELIPDIVSENL